MGDCSRTDELRRPAVAPSTTSRARTWPKTPPDSVEPERVPVVVKAGGAAFHHGWTFHGSGPNEATVERRALSRYRRRGDLSLDESFFPVLWDDTGARSAWLAGLPQLP